MPFPAMHAVYAEWGLMALAFPIVCARLYFQRTRKGRFFWSDLFVVLAWVFFAFQTAADFTMRYHYPPGNTYVTVNTGGRTTLGSLRAGYNMSQTILIAKMKYSENATYYSCLYCVKFAWLCFFHTLLPRTLGKLRKTYWVTVFLTVAGWLFTSLIAVFWCWPVSRRWTLDETYCAQPDWTWMIIMTWHFVTDLLIYLLPIIMLRYVHALKRQSRITVTVIFSLGFICLVWAVAVQVENITYAEGAVICITMAFEQFWAVFVVCLPPLKAMVSREMRLMNRWYKRRGSESQQPGGRRASWWWRGSGNATTTEDPESSADASKVSKTVFVSDEVELTKHESTEGGGVSFMRKAMVREDPQSSKQAYQPSYQQDSKE